MTPGGGEPIAPLEWPCRLVGAVTRCPICASHGDTPTDKAHRRAVLEAATERNRK